MTVNMEEEAMRVQQEMDEAGSVMQAGLRGYSVRQGFQEMDDAAQTVQAGVSGKKVRQVNNAAKVVQSSVRGADERRNGPQRRFDAEYGEETEEGIRLKEKALGKLSQQQREAYESVAIPCDLLRKMFAVLDPKATGSINMGDFLRGLKLFGKFSMNESSAFMKMMGVESKDGDLDYEAFLTRREELLEKYDLKA